MAIKIINFQGAPLRLSYEILNAQKSEAILFLHGWGANKELMKSSFGACFGDFCHIYLDLPGFGGSEITNALNSNEVKAVVAEFLSQIGKSPKIIIGHSFGGKIALLLNPQTLVLLSSAGIVLPKRLWTRFKIRAFKIAKKFGLSRFYTLFATKDVKGMSVVMYEMLKKVVNEDMSRNFADFQGKMVIFWGKNDTTTPMSAAQKINELARNSRLFKLEGDHFFFLDKGKLIERTILEEGR